MAKRKKLRNVRLHAECTQRDVSDGIGISQNIYSRIERGYMDGSVKHWKNIQAFFHLPDSEIWELMKDGTDEENDSRPADRD